VATVVASPPRPRAVVRRRVPRRRTMQRLGTVLLFMAPWVIGFVAFIVYPMLSSLYFSFTNYDLISQPKLVGLSNYTFMLHDPMFWQSIRNTVWIIVIVVPLRIVVAMVTAMLLTRPKRGVKVYRTIFFVPYMAPAVAAALAFVYLFNPATGPVNQALRFLGWRNPPLWFYSPQWSKPGLLLLSLWGIGDAMIIFLAGLLDVPRQLYEAADIEGASPGQKFRHVTLPSISPVIFFSLVIGIIAGFQFFTQAYVASLNTVSANATGASSLGAPQQSLMFYSVYLYQQGFRYFHMGVASAMAWVLFIITMACTLLIIKGSKRWVYYAGGGFR
jgi:multiple sugar transport system permease protein